MTHYTVLVIGNDIEEKLAPYEEKTNNPNSKWDWYQIGGRWPGMLKLKNGYVDQARFGDIDWIAMKKERIRDKHNQWNEHLAGRNRLWANNMLSQYGTMENYINTNNHLTYAIITDDSQWHAPGEMGWFGCSSESDKESQKWSDEYYDRFLTNLSPDTLITIVDCHI